MVKTLDELQWLLKNSAEVLWVFRLKSPTDDLSPTKDMLIEKLLKNPKVLGLADDKVAILQIVEPISWGVLKKMIPAKHLVLFGISPADLGIHHFLNKYESRKIGEVEVIWADAPDELPLLSAELKGKLVKELQKMKTN